MVGSVELYGGGLGYIVKSVGLHGRVLSYMVESAGLHGSIGYMVGVLDYMVECSVICWGVGLHDH